MSETDWIEHVTWKRSITLIDFSYRPSVLSRQKYVEKSKMADNVPVAMGSSGDQAIF